MAIDYSNMLQGLGAMAMAFSDPRQSLMMSQGVFRNLELARERKRREEEQAAQVAESARRWRAEQAVREGRLALDQQQFTTEQQRLAQEQAGFADFLAQYGGAPSPTAPMAFGDYASGVVSNPQTARYAPAMSAAQETVATGMPALPQIQRASFPRTLAPSVFDLQPAPPPPGFAPPGRRAPRPPATEESAPNESSTYRQWQQMMTVAHATGNPRAIAWAQSQKPPTSLVNLEIKNEAEEPKAEPGFVWKRDAERNRVLEDYVDPDTGEVSKRYAQIPAVTKPLGSEETRFMALSKSVDEKIDQVLRVADQLDRMDWATYGASRIPGIGKFFSDTTGGRFSTLQDALLTDSLYQVSGSEAPPREIAQRYKTYGIYPWDGTQTIRWKMENLRALSKYSLQYRLNKGIDEDDELTKEQMDELLLGHDVDFARMNNVPPPPPVPPPSGFSYSGFDPKEGLHVYINEAGARKFARPQ